MDDAVDFVDSDDLFEACGAERECCWMSCWFGHFVLSLRLCMGPMPIPPEPTRSITATGVESLSPGAEFRHLLRR